MKTNKKGISLIVLVITIIVMIILATAIILSISGSDVRGKTDEAVNTTDISTAKEIVAVAQSEWELNYDELSKTNADFKSYATDKLKKAGITNAKPTNEGAVNIVYTDKNGDIAIIPEGFVVSSVASENTVENGLVIYRGKEPVTESNLAVAQETRNQFVWVPVDNYERFKRTTKYKATESISDPGTTWSEPFNKTTDDGVTLSISNDLTGEYAEEEKMRASVEEHKGFYIARYEAGKEGIGKVVSKKGATVWDNIPWGESLITVGTEGAVYRARQMYKDSKSVVSTLCYGVQWDATLQFIATKDLDYITNSENRGNYNETPINTGVNDNYAVNNIYDMAGNVWEWTMEAYHNTLRAIRGASYIYDGSDQPVYFRFYYTPSEPIHDIGFRPTLYIK